MDKTIREQRFESVQKIIKGYSISSILELGCGDGKFIPYMQQISAVRYMAVVDKDAKKINKIRRKYKDIDIYCGSFLEWSNICKTPLDGAVAIEVIEHLTSEELQCLKSVIFRKIMPKIVVFTTPNREYNINYPVLHNGFRHNTHVFEFSPPELNNWGKEVVLEYPEYEFSTGFCDTEGSSQMIIFTRR